MIKSVLKGQSSVLIGAKPRTFLNVHVQVRPAKTVFSLCMCTAQHGHRTRPTAFAFSKNF